MGRGCGWCHSLRVIHSVVHSATGGTAQRANSLLQGWGGSCCRSVVVVREGRVVGVVGVVGVGVHVVANVVGKRDIVILRVGVVAVVVVGRVGMRVVEWRGWVVCVVRGAGSSPYKSNQDFKTR